MSGVSPAKGRTDECPRCSRTLLQAPVPIGTRMVHVCGYEFTYGIPSAPENAECDAVAFGRPCTLTWGHDWDHAYAPENAEPTCEIEYVIGPNETTEPWCKTHQGYTQLGYRPSPCPPENAEKQS